MNISISLLSKIEINSFKKKLDQLIEQTIDLPKEAIESYKSNWDEKSIELQLNNFLFLVAQNDNEIVGLILGSPHEGGVGTIIWVLIDPYIQKKGLGSQLFKEACKFYKNKGAHKIKLAVPDEKTVNFYKKQGMYLEGTHQNHWYGADFWSMGMNI